MFSQRQFLINLCGLWLSFLAELNLPQPVFAADQTSNETRISEPVGPEFSAELPGQLLADYRKMDLSPAHRLVLEKLHFLKTPYFDERAGFYWWPGRGRIPVHRETLLALVEAKSASDGTIVCSGWYGLYGKTIVVQYGSGLTIGYAKLYKTRVAAGDKVLSGQLIGEISLTGCNNRIVRPQIITQVCREATLPK